MFTTVLCCLGGAALATASLLEGTIHTSQRRDALRATNAAARATGIRPTSNRTTTNRSTVTVAPLRLADARTERAATSTVLPEGHLAEVVSLDFRRTEQPSRVRARA